jgi:polyisoprenoid-binding protein YceI
MICIGFLILASQVSKAQSGLYRCNEGKVRFISDASLELIEAKSDALKGLLDPKTNRFAFSVDIVSFSGFNSPLQMEHFRENYMEISRFAMATFEGRLIEQIDLSKSGSYEVRAKGKMTIHGISKELILPCILTSDGVKIDAQANLTIALADYNISIPKVVSKKVAEEITVQVSTVLEKGNE